MATLVLDKKIFTRQLEKVVKDEIKKRESATISSWQAGATDILRQEINAAFDRGQSPVEKGGTKQTGGRPRYQGYSKLYSLHIKKGYYDQFGKKLRPVNLLLSGKMRNSLIISNIKNGLKLRYTDEKAEYHDRLGAGKSKVIRRMLPDTGESFSRVITQKLRQLFITLFNAR